MHDDEFMEIINNSNLSDISDIELHQMSVRDLHLGLKDMAQAMAIIAEFIDDFFSSFDSGEEERPGLVSNAIIHAKDMFTSSKKFCQEFYEDDEDYDDEEDDDDDDGVEEEE